MCKIKTKLKILLQTSVAQNARLFSCFYYLITSIVDGFRLKFRVQQQKHSPQQHNNEH